MTNSTNTNDSLTRMNQYLTIFPGALAFFSAIFITVSLYYHYQFYSNFGFNAFQYFWFNDYFQSNTEGLYLAIFGCISFGIVTFICHKIYRTEDIPLPEEKSRYKIFVTTRRFLVLTMAFAFVLFVFFIAVSLIDPPEDKNYNSSLYILIITANFLFFPSIMRFFKITMGVGSIISLVIICLSYTHLVASNAIVDVETKIKAINSQEGEQCGEYTFSANIASMIDACDVVMIGANSSYVFFVEKYRGESMVIKRENVIFNKIPIPEKQENFIKKTRNWLDSWFDD